MVWVRAFFAAWALLLVPGWLLSVLGIVVPSVITLPLHLAAAVAIRRAAARPGSYAADDVSWRTAMTLVPFALIDPRSWIAATNPLLGLRSVFATFAAAVALVGVAAVVVADGEPAPAPFPADVRVGLVAFVVAAGVVSLFAPRLVPQRLDGADPVALASSYRQRFFPHVAAAEAPALLAFVVCIVRLERWVYLVGALFAAVGFWRLAPTGVHLARDQEALTVSGCPWALAEVLSDR